MSLDIMTLALAKSYTDQHGGGGGGGENTIYIPATVVNVSDEGVATIETSVTFEQIDAAYRSGKEQILKIGLGDDDSSIDGYLLPLVSASPGNSYCFGAIFGYTIITADVDSNGNWSFAITDIMELISMLFEPITQEILSSVKPAQVTSGSDITLADNTEYRLRGVDRLKLTYPEGNFECWMRLSFTDIGTINVTFPSTTQYIGDTPEFDYDETWELSIKDGVVIAQKVGDGI